MQYPTTLTFFIVVIKITIRNSWIRLPYIHYSLLAMDDFTVLMMDLFKGKNTEHCTIAHKSTCWNISKLCLVFALFVSNCVLHAVYKNSGEGNQLDLLCDRGSLPFRWQVLTYVTRLDIPRIKVFKLLITWIWNRKGS